MRNDMNTWILMMGILLVVFLGSCKDEDEPCTSWPCEDMTNHPHQVAYNPKFRIGTWVNVNPNVPAPDTLIFHNDSILTKWNEYGGLYNAKYDFWFVYLRIYTDRDGNEVNPPVEKQTHYANDTLFIYRGASANGFIDEYIKID